MRLETSIQPRRDGSVTAVVGNARYVFTSVPPDGSLQADVDNDQDASYLLSTGNFYPANEADYANASAMLAEPEEGGYEDDDDDANPGGLPIEANTPPAPRRGRRKKAE